MKCDRISLHQEEPVMAESGMSQSPDQMPFFPKYHAL